MDFLEIPIPWVKCICSQLQISHLDVHLKTDFFEKTVEKSWASLAQFYFPKSPIIPVTLPCGPGVKWSFQNPWKLTSWAKVWIQRDAKWFPQSPTKCQMLCYVLVILCWTQKAGSLSLMLSGVDYDLIGEISQIVGYTAVNSKSQFYLTLNLEVTNPSIPV